ncbi:hypothetical protein HM1_0459 [Heliomicrobium modesticaldum Ice1]|uniref:Uncharacterized protein n=1 Tax=Heliobacterium modesticaldum (strain ATCC 51547 / Ice1) TaxID=498761 RepID=B0TFH7_HELMI|nr:hypothetical protein HM1_0459 [Heliomicrobium modesticaldum Ice1]
MVLAVHPALRERWTWCAFLKNLSEGEPFFSAGIFYVMV